MPNTKLVLASRSSIRKLLLADTGLAFEIDAADVDEESIGKSEADPARRAMMLAEAKAVAVSKRHPGALVIGADQVGVLDGGMFLEKPVDAAAHKTMLCAMAGRTHRFFPAAVLVRDAQVIDSVCEIVAITFRAFSEATAQQYVASGEGASSCGGYESEHRGAQLIERIDGSTHAVLGLPLLGLLAALRRAAPELLLP